MMKAWVMDPKSKQLELLEHASPTPRQGAVVVRVEAAMVLSYMNEVLMGERGATFPDRPFIPGTNGIGVIEAVGAGVYHLQPGQRVSLHPHIKSNEQIQDPAQILMGHLARDGDGAQTLQNEWVDGAFAEIVEWPAHKATPIDVLGDIPAVQALALAKFVVPYGGLLRVGVQAGETVVVNGASGFYGSAGVLVAIAMGASRVLAVGRDKAALDAVCTIAGPRANAVALTGNASTDIANLRAAAGGGLDAALDIVGADTSLATACVLRSLRRGGRMAMMGSCAEPLSVDFGEMLINDWLIAGQFMYPDRAVMDLVRLVASGQLPLTGVPSQQFPLAQLPEAMTAAEKMKGLELTALIMR